MKRATESQSQLKDVNMEAVARAAGVHRTTVSMALRGHPKLPEATRVRIRELAERMGYRPNPLVQALMSTRAARGRGKGGGRAAMTAEGFVAELAFVSRQAKPAEWERERGLSAYGQMFRGAREQAARRGYRLSYWWREEPGMTGVRFAQILEARNIHGVLIAPHSGAGNRIDMPWERFSVMEVGYNLIEPDFHRVVHDYFHGMRLALARVREAGARRVALVLPWRMDEKVHHLWRAAFVDGQRLWPVRERIAPWVVSDEDAREGRSVEVFARWFERCRPEIIVAPTPRFVEPVAKAAGLRVPDDVGFVNLSCHEREGRYSGIFQDWSRMGATAVDMLIGMMHRGERGVPEQAHSTLVSGLWVPGRTLGGGRGGAFRNEVARTSGA
ncbi:LacI family DNA-binding transcriptional regulator [Geminisphaera colitermitum]|uniref:LacI family DNA-binding transcriptional regulator n=1 Tax=Geminisphaera colitermitum TaxID=1148786 RepID=UPI0009DCC77D|nr:LacI family DNA-binding transcriptional regulator [Geminisphaera colitermitum]